MSEEVLPAGTVVGERYVVEDLLGRGGMAAVYRARHVTLGTSHAVKVLTLASKSLQKRLVQEGRVQAELRHPNVVAVTDVIDVNGAPGLVMELIRGPSLEQLLERRPLDFAQADAIATGILDAVGHAHAQGWVHRDLKPSNVLLEVGVRGLVPKVADFGLVKLLDEAQPGMARTRTGSMMGTPAYMAPEQIRDASTVDVRADVFALGAILYELVGGGQAFRGDDLLSIMTRVAAAEYTPIRERVPAIPDRMARAIEGALVADRDQRIPTVTALQQVWSGGAAAKDSLWDAALLRDVAILGPGDATVGQASARSSPAPVPAAGPGAPAASPPAKPTLQVAAPTFPEAEGAPSLPTLAPTDGPSWLAPAAPAEPVVAARSPGPLVPAPEKRSLAPAAFALGSAALAGGLGLVALVVAAVAWTQLGGGSSTDQAPPVEVIARPPEEPVAPPSAAAPAADAPTPTTAPTPAPGPRPSPAPGPRPSPAPGPRPSPAPLPSPASETPPAPVEPPGEAEAPAPVTAPAPAAAAPPVVEVDADVTVSFLGPDGRPVDRAALGVGTWQIVAFFEDGVPTPQGALVLAPGSHARVRCRQSAGRCNVSYPSGASAP